MGCQCCAALRRTSPCLLSAPSPSRSAPATRRRSAASAPSRSSPSTSPLTTTGADIHQPAARSSLRSVLYCTVLYCTVCPVLVNVSQEGCRWRVSRTWQVALDDLYDGTSKRNYSNPPTLLQCHPHQPDLRHHCGALRQQQVDQAREVGDPLQLGLCCSQFPLDHLRLGETDLTKEYDCKDVFDPDCTGNKKCFEQSNCVERHLERKVERAIVHPNYNAQTYVSRDMQIPGTSPRISGE